MSRPSWDEYFLSIAKAVAARGTCDRKRVGAVIAMNNHIIATGYNGAPKGLDHCDDVGYLMVHGHCVAGDTVISKFQTGRYNTGHRTIREIWQKWQHLQKRGAMMRMRIRSVTDGGAIVPDHIVDVWKVGKKPLIRITTDLGRTIRVTEDHRMLVSTLPNEWVCAGSLRIGDRIGLNGVLVCDDPEWLRKKYVEEGLDQLSIARLIGVNRKTISDRLDKFGIEKRPFRLGGWNRGFRGEENHNFKYNDVSRTVARARSIKYAPRDRCAVCGATDKVQIHHRDQDVYNNRPENLIPLCIGCHTVAHTPHAKLERVVFDKIVSIEPGGDDDVFDLTTSNNHNFVADGMVVHNCCRVVHAECNAIAQAAMHGAKTDGATIYVTASPCSNCMRLIVNAGIVRVVYGEFYRDQDSIELADKANIELVHYVSVTG